MGLPDFMVVGVAKAGTTALHAALAQHPDLFFPEIKEPKYFLTDGRPPQEGGPGDRQTYQEHVWRREDYEALFEPAGPGQLKGEATPFYLYEQCAHPRMHATVPDAKLIVVLRNPIDRAHSNWAHLWAAGLETESDFLAACAREEPRREARWADFWHYKRQGLYGRQLRNLLRYYDREQVLVMRYRDLREEPAVTLDRVCAFLGVPTGVVTSVPRHNVSPYVADTARNAALRHVLRFGGWVGHHFPVPARRAISLPLLRLLQRHKGPRPKLTDEQRYALLPYFREDIELLEDVSGYGYHDWLEVAGRPVTVD